MKPYACLVLLAVPGLAAAAPKVDYLFPAGGQRGTSVPVIASGTFDAWPAQAWASHPGIVLTPDKKAGRFDVKIAADVPCGVHWLRFHDQTGPGGLRPFLVNQTAEVLEKEP